MNLESRAPRATDWADIVELLHGFHNVVTVRSRYPGDHPAIARADDLAAAGFARLFEQADELVVALIDGEFVISERPFPDLHERLPGFAEAMTVHDIECLVFQRGITSAECAVLGQLLGSRATPGTTGQARERAQASLTHVLLRFAELRAHVATRGSGPQAAYLVPRVHEMLAGVVHALSGNSKVDRSEVQAVAEEILARCAAQAFAVEQRSYAEGVDDAAGHATNVAMMTAAMALEAGLASSVCREVTEAALLHDVGQLLLPARIRGIPEPLLDVEGKRLFRYHPFLGARALLVGGCPALWVAAALDHHRGVDGRGYPALDVSTLPHELVRIVALANFFDKKRTLMNGTIDQPTDVLSRAFSLEARYFDRATLDGFLHALGVFPPGTTVRLSDRQAAMVTRANPGDALRPEVTILLGPNAGRRVDLKDLDATERRHALSIVEAIAPPLVVREPSPSPTDPPEAFRASDLYAIVGEAPRVPSLSPGQPSLAPRAEIPASEPDPFESPERIPRVLVSSAAMTKLPLDARAGFVLSLMDGASTLEMILDVSGLGRAELARIVNDLLRHGTIALG